MAKRGFYAVKAGRTPGIYFTWDDCKAQVDGFSGAAYKKCESVEDAYSYISTEEPRVESVAEAAAAKESEGPKLEGPYAFVDGSFNSETGVYGYGGFLDVNGRRFMLEGSGSDKEMASMRNVAGEIEGSMAAVRKAEELGLRQITLLYDYKGIEEWACGRWRAEKSGTQAYASFMQPTHRSVEIDFQKVAAHTGIDGNEMADVIAKHAVGVDLTKKQAALYQQACTMGVRDGVAGAALISDAEKESTGISL